MVLWMWHLPFRAVMLILVFKLLCQNDNKSASTTTKHKLWSLLNFPCTWLWHHSCDVKLEAAQDLARPTHQKMLLQNLWSSRVGLVCVSVSVCVLWGCEKERGRQKERKREEKEFKHGKNTQCRYSTTTRPDKNCIPICRNWHFLAQSIRCHIAY